MILLELSEREAEAVISALASKMCDLRVDKTILANKVVRIFRAIKLLGKSEQLGKRGGR